MIGWFKNVFGSKTSNNHITEAKNDEVDTFDPTLINLAKETISEEETANRWKKKYAENVKRYSANTPNYRTSSDSRSSRSDDDYVSYAAMSSSYSYYGSDSCSSYSSSSDSSSSCSSSSSDSSSSCSSGGGDGGSF